MPNKDVDNQSKETNDKVTGAGKKGQHTNEENGQNATGGNGQDVAGSSTQDDLKQQNGLERGRLEQTQQGVQHDSPFIEVVRKKKGTTQPNRQGQGERQIKSGCNHKLKEKMDEQHITAVKKDKNDNCINQCDSRIKYKEQNKEKMEKNNQKT